MEEEKQVSSQEPGGDSHNEGEEYLWRPAKCEKIPEPSNRDVRQERSTKQDDPSRNA